MEHYNTRIDKLRFRNTVKEDSKLIVEFIREIAEYEKMLDDVIATEESIEKSIFTDNKAEVMIIEYDKKPIGYILYFFNYSTFMGRAGLYLEDIYIQEEYRGLGFGKEAFLYLSQIAKENNCKRMEWVCLDWNEPSRKFYEKLGAVPKDEWIIYRLDENGINDLENKIIKKDI